MPGKIPPAERPATDPARLDLASLGLLVGLAATERVRAAVEAAGFPGIRFAHGFIFQHLLRGDITVGELAEELGTTAQAASRAIADLEEQGYVERCYDTRDARIRQLRLTERGRGAVEAGRAARAEIEAELADRLGGRRVAAARRLLAEALDDLGGADAVRRPR